MGYTGKTLHIDCSKGGLVENPNIDALPPEAMIYPTRNLNLHEGGRKSRGGTSHLDASAMSGTPQVMGVYDFTLESGTQFVMRACNDGKIYKSQSATIKTGMSTTNFYGFETFENELYIFDGASRPQTWDGAAAATSDISSIPSDWSGTSYPQFMIKHGRGVSERMWAMNLSSNPMDVYASENGDAKDFSDANVIKIHVQTKTGSGIIGGFVYGDRLFVVGKTQTYLIEDTSSDTSDWGYSEAQWEGGAAHWRLICKTPNDVVCMDETGEIYSVRAAEQYGDYQAASLARPAYIHKWLTDNADLTKIAQFHMVYDPVLRAVKLFVVRDGQTEVDTALVYFVDRKPSEAWMVHDNQTSGSGYTASSAGLVRTGVGNYEIYTGDYSGFVWKLEQTNKNDNGNAYYAGFKTPPITMEDPRTDKRFKRLWITSKPVGDWSLYVRRWVNDQTSGSLGSIRQLGVGTVLGSFELDVDRLGTYTLSEDNADVGEKGSRIQFEIYNSSVDENFFISSMMIDWKPLGKEPS
jgi:hypothetical protein